MSASRERPPFHLALPIPGSRQELARARAFYVETLGAGIGREDADWVDLDLWGHQVTLHRIGDRAVAAEPTNPVDGDEVPIPHFGLVLPWAEWQELARRLEQAGTEFVIAPRVRFEGQPGEQATLFLRDPAGNAIELKSFQDPARLFAS